MSRFPQIAVEERGKTFKIKYQQNNGAANIFKEYLKGEKSMIISGVWLCKIGRDVNGFV